jgi:hypothetical protein
MIEQQAGSLGLKYNDRPLRKHSQRGFSHKEKPHLQIVGPGTYVMVPLRGSALR